MREIKFEAFDTISRKMLSGIVVGVIDGKQVAYQIEDGQCKWIGAISIESIRQYTGLHNKNGKEIYEGDIFGDVWGDGWIAYCDKCKSFEHFLVDFGCQSCSGDVKWDEVVEDDGKFEVIGNIYENPERLQP